MIRRWSPRGPVTARAALLLVAALLVVAGCGHSDQRRNGASPAERSMSAMADDPMTTMADDPRTSAADAPAEASASGRASSPDTPRSTLVAVTRDPGGSTTTVALPPASTRTRPVPTSGSTGPDAAFHASIRPIDADLAERMASSYRQGCPVPPTDLRYLTLTYRGFDGRAHTGELIVSARVADDVVGVFKTLYTNDFPIRSMRLVDDFGGSDDASMAADNTSAFNCRAVTGGGGWSEHSYGEAIDINPRENPYISGSTILPPEGARFTTRPDLPGVIHAGDVAVRAFTRISWTWGGSWTSPVDLQHFSRSGR